MPIRKNFPSLNALLVLEAAARHRSFTAAAVELGVTQAAVSRQVALLEEELDTPLFARKHRSIEPTPPCELLASSLAMSFANIAQSVEMVRSTKRQETVTIGATLAFTTFWLLPRMGEFRKRYPAAQIRLVSQDSRINLNSGEVDVLVRFGVPPFDDGEVVASRADEVFPVCSAEHALRVGEPGTMFRDGELELIEQDVPDRSWYSWQDWLGRAGIAAASPQPKLRFSHYTEVLQAARAGHGVALGWGVLVQSYLEDGSLVRLGDAVITAEGRYNVVVPTRRKPHPLRDIFVEWLAGSLCK
ncbi:LysR substrate-binding domain-containing protein [Azohydromonas australica]|uniref:LysR substrate-binding domain-containing protein n=1 Tax=Azohydromonas australica TaxID=364039 RepID=UPI0004029814|nr:LysR substrate-binding domain-containing protein [Azohydromonas australica]